LNRHGCHSREKLERKEYWKTPQPRGCRPVHLETAAGLL
jgi:hypothetical protein